MADKICQATDGNWNTAGNWSPSGVPASNDRAWISEGLQNSLLTGLTQGGIDLDLLHIPAGYRHNIGATGSQLQIAADEVRHYGSGELHYSCKANAAALITDQVRFRGADTGVLCELDSYSGDAGNFTRIVGERGILKILGNALFSDSGGILSIRENVTLSIASGADSLPDFVMTGGAATVYNAFTNAFILGGTFTKEASTTIALLVIGPGGRAIVNGTGTITKAIVTAGGILDLRQSVQVKTITTLYAFLGSDVLYDPNLLSYTNFYDFREETP